MNPTELIQEPQTEDEVLHCTVHPDRETTLHCNKCGRPMCAKCAVLTPVGYRCRECVHGIQAGYYQATQADYILIFAVCGGLTGLGAAIFAAVNLGILFTLILALPAGGLIAEAGLRLTSRRRGRQSATIAALGAVIGGLVGGVVQLLLRYGPALSRSSVPVINFVLQNTVTNISLLLFVALAAAAVYGRFKMRS